LMPAYVRLPGLLRLDRLFTVLAPFLLRLGVVDLTATALTVHLCPGGLLLPFSRPQRGTRGNTLHCALRLAAPCRTARKPGYTRVCPTCCPRTGALWPARSCAVPPVNLADGHLLCPGHVLFEFF